MRELILWPLVLIAGLVILRSVEKVANASPQQTEENKGTSGFLTTSSMSGSIYRFCDTKLSIACYERSAIVSCVKY